MTVAGRRCPGTAEGGMAGMAREDYWLIGTILFVILFMVAFFR